MEMAGEMMDSALEDALDGDEVEEETEGVVAQASRAGHGARGEGKAGCELQGQGWGGRARAAGQAGTAGMAETLQLRCSQAALQLLHSNWRQAGLGCAVGMGRWA